MKTTVFYHSADYDGIFCREIARKFLPDAELIGWDFPDKPLPIPDEGQIYILDLPVDRVFGFQYGDGAIYPLLEKERIVWIDHHKSSIETHPTDIPGYRINGVAACRLAWQWFTEEGWHPHRNVPLPDKQKFIDRKVSEPLAVRLAGEYDIWDKRDPRAEVFQFGLRSRELTDFDWNQILSTEKPTIDEIEKLVSVGHQGLIEPDGTCIPAIVAGLLESGKILQVYQQRNDAGMMHRSFIVEFEGLKFLALTTARCNSLTFMSKDVPETGHDALMAFYYNGTDWNFSLYNARHRMELDLSKIAVKYGGGGHKGACGFRCSSIPFNQKG